VAGGLTLGREVCSGGVFAGRVAVASGGAPVWAPATCRFTRKMLDSSDTASVLRFIDPAPPKTTPTKTIANVPFHASSCLPIGSARMRLPVAANMASIRAGANGGAPGSPTPLGGVLADIRQFGQGVRRRRRCRFAKALPRPW
jgi:hypothetical protein